MGRKIFFWTTCLFFNALLAADWPQLAGNPQRTSWSPDSPQPPFSEAWTKILLNERIWGWHQPIIGDADAAGRETGREKVFLGTVEGKLHCWRLDNAFDLWFFQSGGPIMQSAGYADGRVFPAPWTVKYMR